MKNKEKIIVMGDLHGCFDQLNTFINKHRPALILQAGDMGVWPSSRSWAETPIKSPKTKIHFCDGNHEDYNYLEYIKPKGEFEVQPNTFWQPRGSTMTLPDGRVVLFMGGAWSIDWQWRTDGVTWFKKEELISEDDFNNIKVDDVDIVISHTAPHEFEMGFSGEHENDISRKWLSDILFKFEPKLWYFGHWHTPRKSTYIFPNGKKCKWTCLDMLGNERWYEELESV